CHRAEPHMPAGASATTPLRRRKPLSSPIHKPDPGLAPRPLLAGAPKPQPETPHELLTPQKSSFAVHTEKESPERQEMPLPTARELMEKKVEMARLAEEVQRDSVAYAKRPKKKFISAN